MPSTTKFFWSVCAGCTASVVRRLHGSLHTCLVDLHQSAKSAGGAENAGVDNVAPSSRGGKCGEIRRPKKKWNMLNDKRIKAYIRRCDNGAYSRIQFLTVVTHSMGAHTEALCPAAYSSSSSSSDEDETSSATTRAADSSL